MLYTPPDPSKGLWDTWVFQHGDLYHLFHLQRDHDEVGCSSIGHAVTRDWRHWKTLPPVLAQDAGDTWDNGPLMTGMVVEHAGRFFMFYGAMVDRVQRIGLAVSDDLIHWEKLGQNPVLEPGGPWYETDPRRASNYETAWRDPYVFYHAPDACYYAFLCARVANASETGGGCIAIASSRDLLDWTLLPPAYVSDTLTCLEVPEYFALNGRHYITYTTSYHFGTPYPVDDPYQATGTFYLESGEMLAGYAAPDHPNTLVASLPNSGANYVGRSIPHPTAPARRLYYYQNVPPVRLGESEHGSLAAPKQLEALPDGRLNLTYAADILDPLFEDTPLPVPALQPDRPIALTGASLDAGEIAATVRVPYAGICLHVGPQREGMPEGLAVWTAPNRAGSADRWVMLGTVHLADGPSGVRPVLGRPAALRKLTTPSDDRGARLRVMWRGPFVDVYVEDTLYLSHAFAPEELPSSRQAGVFRAGTPAATDVTEVVVRRMQM
ncbi:MAG: hypothetical protein GX613_09745 [Chloroflexi bacterium]|nr:hypothetical protein [Chloroflexota bacterium]